MTSPPIPQCNPRAAYHAQAEAIDAAIRRVLDSERYILGNEVSAFEAEFADYIGTRHALGVANGTDAITIALKALEIGPGDVVLTVSHSAVATAVAIRSADADPLFIDVDADSGVMDLDCLEAQLAALHSGGGDVTLDRVKAIIPVHLYGHSVDMPRLCALAAGYGLQVVEDCAQAHGARCGDRRVGSFGAFGCFSFYPTKNLGAIGDGGAITCNDPALLEKARLQREYGWRQRYISDIEGGNSRLDELQAALLRVKLTRLDQDNHARVAIAEIYRNGIHHPQIRLPAIAAAEHHVYHQFAIRCHDRDGLQAYLKQHGIGTLVHYPRAIHQQPAYANALFAPNPLPVTEDWSASVLSLPMFPQLDQSAAMRVASTINTWPGSAA